jgi:HK97 family phage prohead protease
MLTLYATITKLDHEQRLVFGYASTETMDQQGEIVRREALEAALPDYMRFANIREMHLPSAVGVAQEAEVDDKGLFLGAKVVDRDAWEKVKAGVYKGFSIGGRVTRRDPDDRSIITGVELTEISLVDRPANPDAVFAMMKHAEGALRPLPGLRWDCGDAGHAHANAEEASRCIEAQMGARRLAKIGARNSKADLARIQTIHDQAVDLGASCPGHAADDRDDDDAGMQRMARERDSALAAVQKLNDRMAPLLGDLDALKKRLAVVEAQPLPAKGLFGPIAISKEDDHGIAESGLAARLAHLPAGQERADEILRHAHFIAAR